MTPKNVVITDPDEEQETTNNAVPDEDVPEDVEDVDVDVEGSVDNPFADVPADQMPVDEIPIEIRTEEDMEEGGTGHGMPDEAGNAKKPLEDPIFDDGRPVRRYCGVRDYRRGSETTGVFSTCYIRRQSDHCEVLWDNNARNAHRKD